MLIGRLEARGKIKISGTPLLYVRGDGWGGLNTQDAPSRPEDGVKWPHQHHALTVATAL